MKTIVYLVSLIVITSCNSQIKEQNNMKSNKELTLEELKKQGYQLKEADTILMKDGKLDIEYIIKNGDKYTSGEFWGYDITLEDGTHIYITGDDDYGYSKKVTKKDELITTSYGYYPSGNPAQTAYLYPNFIKKGTWYWYNEKGQINRLEEYDKPYKYTWEDVLEFMQEKDIEKENIQHIYREVKKEKHTETPYWYIAKTIERDGLGSPTTAIQYTLDGNTGRVLKEAKLDVTRHLLE